MKDHFDVVIAGAGPAGCSLALYLFGSGLSIAMIEKEQLPKRKVCGGAVSDRALNRLKEFPETLDIYNKFITNVVKSDSYGLRVFTPDHREIEFNYKNNGTSQKVPGYICERKIFDDFLFEQVKSLPDVTLFENTEVTDVHTNNNEARVSLGDRDISCKIIIGADGANSIVRRKLGSKKKYEYDAGISAHFENVTGFHGDGLIDIYFLKDLLPGYFWIFSLPGNRANAGIFMPSGKLKRHKLDIKKKMNVILSCHPVISKRFKEARQTDDIKGSLLPVNKTSFRKYGNIYGNRFILIGDAAGLIDPITGEGIGNAFTSARFASDVIPGMIPGDDSGKSLKKYGSLMYRKFGREMIVHRMARHLFRYPFVLENCFRLIRKCMKVNCLIRYRLYKG